MASILLTIVDARVLDASAELTRARCEATTGAKYTEVSLETDGETQFEISNDRLRRLDFKFYKAQRIIGSCGLSLGRAEWYDVNESVRSQSTGASIGRFKCGIDVFHSAESSHDSPPRVPASEVLSRKEEYEARQPLGAITQEDFTPELMDLLRPETQGEWRILQREWIGKQLSRCGSPVQAIQVQRAGYSNERQYWLYRQINRAA